MNIHYAVTGLLTVVWRSHSELTREEGGSELIAHIRDIQESAGSRGGGPRVVVSTAAFHASVGGSVPGLGGLKETKMFLPIHV